MEYNDVPYTAYFKETVAALDEPGCLLVTQGHEGSLNAMVIGWGIIGTIWQKAIFTVLVRPSRFTYQLLEEGSAFTVCVPTPEMRPIVNVCGNKSGRSHDKFRELNLSTVPSTQISVPGIAGSSVIYECQPVHFNDLQPEALTAQIQERFYPQGDFHRVYFGEILAVRALVSLADPQAGQVPQAQPMATFEPGFEPGCLPAALGSLPLTDPQEACELVLEHFPQLPMWPQLPRRSFLENMYVQFSQGLPGVIVGPDSIRVDREHVEAGLEKLYVAYLGNRPADVAISASYAAGLAALSAMPGRVSGALAVKGHLTGPISLGLQITDLDRRPILYDEILADAVAKLLRLKATWQEETLKRLNPRTIIFVDEPYLSTFGSAYIPISREQVLIALEEVLAGIQGLKGLHCCGNTDWSMLLETSMDIISFDAYHYALPFSLYAGEIRSFLARGGTIAWGIVPNDPALLEQETVDSLADKLLEAMDLLVQKGLARDDLLQRALITASCGLGTLPVASAVRACRLTADLSALMRSRYLRKR